MRTNTSLPQLTRDALAAYASKRDFTRTPEPQGDAGTAHGPLRFVVQKHWASSLHYDFRLQWQGTLKSWAVPKGPSLDPKIKRMAVQVEDHPLDYADFEGTVPSKQYGAGQVIVWDQGVWTPLGDVAQAWRDGNLKFRLQGHKLQGAWVLVRIKGKDGKQPAWLLIKEKDSFARASAAYSVVEALPHSVVGGGGAAAGSQARQALPAQAVAADLPARLAPQLATLASGLPSDPANWLFEIKFDGYRMLVRIDAAGVRLVTRNGHDWTAKLLPLQQALVAMRLPSGWYDGEIVLPDEAGMPDFGALQQAFDTGQTDAVVLYLFDLPYVDGHDLRAAPVEARRSLLQQLLSRSPSQQVWFSQEFAATAQRVLASACELGLEGIIAKRRGAHYQSARSADWIKLKCGKRQSFVIGGYTDAQGTRSGFGALLLGVLDAQGMLQHVGDVGTGFSEHALQQVLQALRARAQRSSPFAARTRRAGRAHWVAPTLVAEVSFSGWTRAGHLRHAVFRGLRADIDARSIVRAQALRMCTDQPVHQTEHQPEHPPAQPRAHPPAPMTTTPSTPPALPRGLQVTHPDRVIDSSTGTTKLQLLQYHGLVGGLMMKHLLGRPVALVRAPTGIGGELFFQKHAQAIQLPGICQLDPALDPGHPPMLAVVSARGLLSAAQWNVIEIHTRNAITASFGQPDRMVFDLDPGAGVPWAQVQEAAQLTHAFLTQLGLAAFLKTSGGKGLHIVVPIRRQHGADTVNAFAQAIVQHLARVVPQRFVAKSGPKNRVGKIFIDHLRNGAQATTVCAWSARARPGLGISVPVAWAELDALRAGDHWTVGTVHSRLHTGNQPWQAYARSARGLLAAMAALGHAPRHA